MTSKPDDLPSDLASALAALQAECGPREQLANDPNSHFAELLRLGLEEALA